jgi:uncharacterized coiled-coil protein SlyX
VSQSTHQTDLPTGISDKTIKCNDIEITLQEVASDLTEAHREIDEYRRSSLVLAQKLKELRMKAEREGNVPLANTTKELEDSAMAVVKRTRE